MTWHILRVFTGRSLKVAETIEAIGIEAYCPSYTVKRRSPFNWRQDHEYEAPLFPGYLFTAEAFDVARINLAGVKTRLMSRGEHFLTVSSIEMQIIREAEKRASRAWQPDINDIIKGLSDCVDGVLPRKFVRFDDLRGAIVEMQGVRKRALAS